MAWLAAAADSRGQCQDQHVLLLLSFYLLLPCRTVLWAHVCVLISESVRANCTENYFTEGYYRRNSPSIFPALFFFLKRIERNSFKCILCCDACWNLKKQFLLIETFIPISQHLNLDKWKKMLFFFPPLLTLLKIATQCTVCNRNLYTSMFSLFFDFFFLFVSSLIKNRRKPRSENCAQHHGCDGSAS